MGCCSCLSKIFLAIFNIIFFLAGILPLVLGIIALVSDEKLKDLLEKVPGTEDLNEIVDLNELVRNFAVAFVVIGAVMAILGFIGCCGAFWTNKCLLNLYLFFIILILLAEIAIVIVAVAFPDIFSKYGKKLLEDNFGKMTDCSLTNSSIACGGKDPKILAWHTMQFELKCCGPAGFTDYNSNKTTWEPRHPEALAPVTCCKHDSTESLIDADIESIAECFYNGTNADEYNQQGCFDAIVEWAVTSAIFIIVLVIVGVLEVLLIIATIVQLCSKSRKSRVR